MMVEQILLDKTVVKFFDDNIEEENVVLKEIENVIQRKIEKCEEDFLNRESST